MLVPSVLVTVRVLCNLFLWSWTSLFFSTCVCLFPDSENKKQNEEAADDMDGFDADEEDDEEIDSDKDMGLDDEDGDEVSSLQLQKLAAEVCFSVCTLVPSLCW